MKRDIINLDKKEHTKGYKRRGYDGSLRSCGALPSSQLQEGHYTKYRKIGFLDAPRKTTHNPEAPRQRGMDCHTALIQDFIYHINYQRYNLGVRIDKMMYREGTGSGNENGAKSKLRWQKNTAQVKALIRANTA
ncbi:unnamed protein product [Dovyalis caffra]|uniref:HNH homing endonuclease n=1 Tax=Dovyalis caffra TaxID=77055 RepID=A0AAV1S9R2_9ROSI|nr:unnamed protein product [Dovyalis caffra]